MRLNRSFFVRIGLAGQASRIFMFVVVLCTMMIVITPLARAEETHIDDVEFFTADYQVTYVGGNCTASLVRELGTGCISGGNSLVVHVVRSSGSTLNYDVHVFHLPHTYVPHDDDPTSSTLSWNFYVKAVNLLDIADFQIMAKQGNAEYRWGGFFEPPANNICYNWSGTITLDQFVLVLGNGTNGDRLDLRSGAAPIRLGWRVYQFANPWVTGFANPKISNVHFTINATHPTVNPIPDQAVVECDTLTVTPVGSDVDGDELFWSGLNLPAGAAVDESTGVFTWSPTSEQAGTYPGVTLIAADGHGGLGSASFPIEVIDNSLCFTPESVFPAASAAIALQLTSRNPFHDRIAFAVTGALQGPLRFRVLDSRGRTVADLGVEDEPTSRELRDWDGRDDHGRPVSQGRYYVLITSPAGHQSLGITLLRD